MLRRLISTLSFVALAACGGTLTSSSRTVSAQQALTQTAEFLEFETKATRAELYRDVARASLAQAGHAGPVMFPVLRDGELVAAPGIEPRMDLLMSADAGALLQLSLDSPGDAWATDRRESFGGLSEREAAELVARSLLNLWGISSTGAIVVERAAGAPWAAAYIDGILRVNPSFVYMAAAPAAQ